MLLSIKLAFCLLGSSTMAMEENKRIPSRPTTAQSVRGKSESRPATATKFVRLPITVREKALQEEQVTATALAAKKARQAQVAEAARKALTKSFQRGASVLTAPPKSVLRTKGSPFVLQASKKSAGVVYWDQKSGGVVQDRKLSSLEALATPLHRMTFGFLDPRDLCEIARTSSKLNEFIEGDDLLWNQIYNQNFPHHFFNRMVPTEKEAAVAQFKKSLDRAHGIDPENPGKGYREAFKFYSGPPENKYGESSWYFAPLTRKSLPAVAILVRSSPLALYILRQSKETESRDAYGCDVKGPPVDFGDVRLWSRAFLESSCFDEAIYQRAFHNISPSELETFIQKGNLMARYHKVMRLLVFPTMGREERRNFLQKEVNALCEVNYFPALLVRLRDLAQGESGEIYQQNPFLAAQEYERCTKLFHQNPEKLLKLKEAYTGEFAPKNSDEALLWLKTPIRD